jgi:hypothetical protein
MESSDNDQHPVSGLKRKRVEADIGGKLRPRRGGGGDGDGNGDGGEPAYLWTPDCNRGSQAFEQALGRRAADIASCGYVPEQNPDVHDDMEALENARETHPNPERQTLSPLALSILVKIKNACKDVMTQKSSGHLRNATEILQMLVQSNRDSPNPVWDVNNAFHDNSLLSIAQRCCHAANLVNTAKFILLLNLMHFRCKVERYVSFVSYVCPFSSLLITYLTSSICQSQPLEGKRQKRDSILKKLAKDLGVTKQTVGRWLKNGSTSCVLANAGMFLLYYHFMSAYSKRFRLYIFTGHMCMCWCQIGTRNNNNESGYQNWFGYTLST